MWGILLGALLLCGLIYLGYKLTVFALQTYRRNKASKIFIGSATEMIKQMSQSEKNKFSMSDLAAMSGNHIVAEYDPTVDSVTHIELCDQGTDDTIARAVSEHNGYIVVED